MGNEKMEEEKLIHNSNAMTKIFRHSSFSITSQNRMEFLKKHSKSRLKLKDDKIKKKPKSLRSVPQDLT